MMIVIAFLLPLHSFSEFILEELIVGPTGKQFLVPYGLYAGSMCELSYLLVEEFMNSLSCHINCGKWLFKKSKTTFSFIVLQGNYRMCTGRPEKQKMNAVLSSLDKFVLWKKKIIHPWKEWKLDAKKQKLILCA